MDKMKCIKKQLVECVHAQMADIEKVDTKELGDAIDMIKDMAEAIYYCTITKAMEGKDKEDEPVKMHYETKHMVREEHSAQEHSAQEHQTHDHKEGRSHMSRRNYMESKEKHLDKNTKMKDLESYIQELSKDVLEMIEGSSSEEKQYLQQKISALATRIGQLNA